MNRIGRIGRLEQLIALSALAASFALAAPSVAAAEETPTQGYVTGWSMKGSLTVKKLGQTITLPEGCSFNGEITVPGKLEGESACPAWTGTLKLFGAAQVKLALKLTQSAPLSANITKGEAGSFTLNGTANENLAVSSVGLMGLTIPTNCATVSPAVLGLEGTETAAELLEHASFSGFATLPSFTCHGGLLGSSLGSVLSALLSGSGNPLTLSVQDPAGSSTYTSYEPGKPGTSPSTDPFYRYEGSKALSGFAPGTVLKTRAIWYHFLGIALPIRVVQLLYRSTGQLGQPTVNVTSVAEPPLRFGTPSVISYQSFYDALTTEADPSYAISGASLNLDSAIPTLESVLIAPALLAGQAVVIPDTEGEIAGFAAGPEYGYNTLDSLRAALASPATGLAGTSKIAMLGYSGGAIATGWAAELAPSYAPEINKRLVGAAMGGVLVDPAHNLKYVEGSKEWAGVMPMALVGISRAFKVNLVQYMNEYGVSLFNKLQNASIAEVLLAYPGLTFAQMTKPEYASPESIKVYDEDANALIMGSRGAPSTPMFIGQGNGGENEGTPGNKPGIGPGDGVMIAGDVRSLARGFCAAGDQVKYVEYNGSGHIVAALSWLPEAAGWVVGRLAGSEVPQNCSSIAAGNSLEPLPIP